MAQGNWEADKMLDVYIHDYLLKKKLHNSAKAFMSEGKVATDPVAIDAPGGFLFEWWSVFWDIFIARTNEKHSEAAAAYIEAQQLKRKEQHQMQMQHLQMLQQRQAQIQQRNSNRMVNGDALIGQSSASVMAMKMYEERMKLPHSLDNESSSSLLDANRLSILKSAASHQSVAPQGNEGSISSLQQIHARNLLSSDGKSEAALGQLQKTIPLDPSIYGQVMQSQTALGGAGLNQRLSNLPLKGWPLAVSGMDTMRPNMGMQMNAHRPNLHLQNQFLSASQQHSMTPNYTQLPRGSLNGSICSPGQSISPKDPPPPSNRKRKHSSCGPANSTGTSNTANSPTSANQKSMLMYGADVNGSLATCANILDDFADIASLDDNMEQFLNDGDSRELYAPVKQSPIEAAKGSSFNEFGCIRARSKVTCCHFSSDGKLLASAGHEKKVVICNMDSLHAESSTEEHKSVITDIRFRPNSSQLATSSMDQTVRLWDVTNLDYSLQTYTGNTPVISVDFHPKKTDLFCFSNNDNEVRYWHVSPFECFRVFKGGSTQVRFQPRSGQLLAAASEKTLTVFDVESDRPIHSFQGHTDALNCVCWDASGEVLASVSQSLVKIWSLTSGQCINEFGSNGNEFHSCVFHPTYSTLLVVGGLSSLELWNMAENKNMTIAAHEDVVAALAQSPVTGMIASASHDASVKLWK